MPNENCVACCANCLFSAVNDSGRTECRQSPPVLLICADGQPHSMFPAVNPDTWCGCWESVEHCGGSEPPAVSELTKPSNN